ncbi:nucleotidyltransferase domain-containing protein [Streptomyces somaliensis DSM 40738]|uniref:Nucleotidyltransferase domain-containing protein n=1 Tax=Streptomyces somaliensis (strain ATCC 33201 / DSM 40738 / JCM 12659 / KCTC 9044 / NCTC 11332 / NRRL B-12077 / IP 733) TaxID=1134445 RepID=A0AA44DF50_STRE0|nr:nucleotidyltransferase domain-containing protein [Streptomyces somaliensis]MCQ0022149.1 nucleotidyltransferase domain-containing protein [Streptomyces somaliensis DSM 40738]NKY14981.1 nucleotidyltransferase domain-containing protein [Streptomyces somaliensis DSM 40738]
MTEHLDLSAVVAEQPDPLPFATVSGAHLYGFPSRDSDVDLRGAHLLPLDALIGLREAEETRSRTWLRDGVEMDLVTHDLRKFVRLMLRRNGYVLEQLLSPLVVRTSDLHAELTALAPGVLTTHHAHHYRGFACTQWRLFERNGELKPLLYTFRALLTGIHLMRSGEVVAHLPTLCGTVGEAPAYLGELIAAKAEAEHGPAAGTDPERLRADVEALHRALDDARAASPLPDAATGARDALHDLLVRARTGQGVQG